MSLKSLLNAAKRGIRAATRPDAKSSWSQCGEDLLIDYVLSLRGIARPSYIDIGTHDPVRLSNTARFYARGCRGINVEANPQLMQRFYSRRPRDVNLNVGVAAAASTMDFFVMQDPTLSTFSTAEKDSLLAHGHKVARVVRVPVQTLRQILDQHNHGAFPDIMSIDVEGMDLEIIRTIDFARACPRVICVEAAEYSPIGAGARRSDMIDYLTANGYLEYANTNLNAIMVNRVFWERA